jgi:hypothetical protein
MRADQRKFHYIYKITRTDGSGKYYIGLHSTDDLDDGYFGSGERLWHSINRHGKDRHEKEILEFLPTRKAAALREGELVNKDILKDPLCLNLALGGFDSPRNEGKKQSEETKRKKSASMQGKHVGQLNPNYGSMWITNGEVEMKAESVPEGFWRGRVKRSGPTYLGKTFEFISPHGVRTVVKGSFEETRKALGLNRAKVREFINKGPIPESATRTQTRNCVGWSINLVTI